MNTTKKEEFLLKQGRKQETIDFCKDLKVPSQKFVWFCERIEKENFNIKDENLKEYIKKCLKLLERTNMYNHVSSLEKLIRYADKYIETDEHESDRILHKFKNGNYIINLSPKELHLEGKEMSNCVGDMAYGLIEKQISILALKDKKKKTLVHFQVNKFGFLEQHYSKANAAVNLEKWKYINEFFDLYKDEQFYEKINATKIDINYNVSERVHNFVPIVEYFIPTKTTNSIFEPEILKINETYHIKDFVNTTNFNFNNIKKQHLNKEEVFNYLNNFKNFINNSIDDIFELLNVSQKNYYNLNNDMIQKIFNSKPPKLDEKIANISSDYKPKMVIDYRQMEEQMEEMMTIPVREQAGGLVGNIGVRGVEGPLGEIEYNHEEELEMLRRLAIEPPIAIGRQADFNQAGFNVEEDMCEEQLLEAKEPSEEMSEECLDEMLEAYGHEEKKITEKEEYVSDFVLKLKNDLTEKEIKSIESIINKIEEDESVLTKSSCDSEIVHVDLVRNRNY